MKPWDIGNSNSSGLNRKGCSLIIRRENCEETGKPSTSTTLKKMEEKENKMKVKESIKYIGVSLLWLSMMFLKEKSLSNASVFKKHAISIS